MKYIGEISSILLFFLATLPVLAGPLNKYGDESSAPVYQKNFSSDQVKRRLNDKMQRSISILSSMEGHEKARWVETYKERLRQALASGDQLKAAYYREILEQANK